MVAANARHASYVLKVLRNFRLKGRRERNG
jgi:hypothetical protein